MFEQNVIDVTVENFQQVLEESFQRLVLLDFWAPWCEPCKTLTPLLEKLAREQGDQLLLAKIDCDAEQAIAGQFGIRSVPTVALFKEGQPVDGFAGAQSEQAVRALLEKHLPKPEDNLLNEASAKLADNDTAGALTLLREAHQLAPERADIKLNLAEAYLKAGHHNNARELLDTVLMQDQDSHYQALLAELELKEQAVNTPEIQSLETRRSAEPDNLDLAYQLAIQYHQVERFEDALELLMTILEKDLGYQDGAVRKTLMDILATLGQGDPLAGRYRRRLYTLLY